jgi:antitoxin YefM
LKRLSPKRPDDTGNPKLDRSPLPTPRVVLYFDVYRIAYFRGDAMGPIRFSEDIRPLSEFRANAAAFIDHVRSTRRPLVLTQHGRSSAVLLDVVEYERLVERAELLDDLGTAEEQISRGEALDQDDALERVRARLRR